MKTIRPIRRKRGPVITWAPAHDSYYIVASMLRGAAGIPSIHVTQASLLEVESDLAAARTPVPFGLLTGQYCVTPDTKIEYLLIDEVRPAFTTLSSSDPTAQLAAELRSLRSDATRLRKLVLGWYIGGMDDDLRLDPDVTDLHRELFPEPWASVLVRNEATEIQLGAFFRYQPVTAQLYSIPFFELVPDPPRRAGSAELRTVVRWANYRARESVLPLASPPSPTTPTPRPSAAGSWKEAFSEWVERLRSGSKQGDENAESSASVSTERHLQPSPSQPPPAFAAASVPARAPAPRPPALPVASGPEPVPDGARVPAPPVAGPHANASAAVGSGETERPTPTVRVTFPALLPDSLPDDVELPRTDRRWVVALTVGVVGVAATSWLVWLLWHR